MASGAGGVPEPHYVSVRARDEHIIVDGGELGSRVHRIASMTALAELLFTHAGRQVLEVAVGAVFESAAFELDEVLNATSILLVPKVVCKPISRRWDQMVTQADIGAAVLPYPLVHDDRTPEGAPFAIRLMEANDADIVDLAI